MRVLSGEDARNFREASGKRGGGKIVVIDVPGAKIVARDVIRRAKNASKQLPLPFPHLTSIGSDRLKFYTSTFRGESLAFLDFEGRRCIPATALGKMLGYGTASELVGLIRREWKAEFVEEDVQLPNPFEASDYAVISGDILKDFKKIANRAGATDLVGANANQLVVLFESGVNKVLLKTHRPDGVAVRDFLAREIMPALSREQPVPPPQHQAPSGMVTGGLSDRGAERFHQAITLNTSFALADKLVQSGQLETANATAVQVALVKELGGVDIFGMAKALAPKPEPATVTYPAPPEKIPAPKAAILPKVPVGEEWTLETNPDAVTIAVAARTLTQDTGRDISPGRVKAIAHILGIHLHHATKLRARTDPGVLMVRRQDLVKMHKHLLEHPALYQAAEA